MRRSVGRYWKVLLLAKESSVSEVASAKMQLGSCSCGWQLAHGEVLRGE